MSSKGKITIIGPFNSRGGREIEVGYIANVLVNNYNVEVYSTEYLDKLNDIRVVSNNVSIYQKHIPLRIKILLRLKLLARKNLYFESLYANNLCDLDNVIKNCDILIIVAQVVSHHLEIMVDKAKKYQKKIIFRTTGTIPLLREHYNGVAYNLNHLKGIDMYVHHSTENANSLNRVVKHNHKIIDQSVFNESALIKMRRERTSITQFYTCSRLDRNKNIEVVVKAFNKLKNLNIELHIYGEGYQLANLKSIKRNKNIHFHGHVPYYALLEKINKHDCLIISSNEEAGPYTGLEAMCLGIPVISTPVGSMPVRFSDFNFMWFDNKSPNTLENRIKEFTNFSPGKLEQIKNKLIDRYHSHYSNYLINDKYVSIVKEYLT